MAKELRIVDYDARWPQRFAATGAALRSSLGDDALRIDHIGSTAVPGLAAKDLIDVQVTVGRFGRADEWPDELLHGLRRRDDVVGDHVPPVGPQDAAEWTKRYWSDGGGVHMHVREQGRANQRYALLFRDYLRADPRGAAAYAAVKRSLVALSAGDWDVYYAVKDPACDLIIAGAEQWAARTGWSPGPSDA